MTKFPIITYEVILRKIHDEIARKDFGSPAEAIAFIKEEQAKDNQVIGEFTKVARWKTYTFQPNSPDGRRQQVIDYRAEGKTLRQIAELMGISHERVRQLSNSADSPRRPGRPKSRIEEPKPIGYREHFNKDCFRCKGTGVYSYPRHPRVRCNCDHIYEEPPPA